MRLPSVLMSAFLVMALVGLSACASAPSQKPLFGAPVDTGPGSLAEARKYLEGRWTLESFDVYQPGKPAVTLKGQGTLTYDAFGNLTMEIRADQAESDLLRASGIEILDGVISSSGRVVVDVPNKTLAYVIEGQPAAGTGPLAMSHLRHWQVDGDVLTMTTKDNAGNPASVGRWRKLQ